MHLTFDEQLALALYLEFFGKRYDPNDNREPTFRQKLRLERHREMQHMHFLLQEANISIGTQAFGYPYYLSEGELYSPKLLEVLLKLDAKEEIYSFYESYCKRRNALVKSKDSYLEQLKEMFSSWEFKECEIARIATLCHALGEIFEQGGAELTALLLYINKYIYGGIAQHSQFLSAYGAKCSRSSVELAERTLNILQILGLIGVRPKSTPKETLECWRTKKFVPSEDK